jgi:hypothetical protein
MRADWSVGNTDSAFQIGDNLICMRSPKVG